MEGEGKGDQYRRGQSEDAKEQAISFRWRCRSTENMECFFSTLSGSSSVGLADQ
jgi:hypothetical protein